MMSSKSSVIIVSIILHACAQYSVNAQFNSPFEGFNSPFEGVDSHRAPSIGFTRDFVCKRTGFSARRATAPENPSQQFFSAPAEITFKDILSSFGHTDSFDNTQFCAKGPGWYFFSFHAMSSGNGDFTMALMKNGVYQVTANSGQGKRIVTGSDFENYQQAGNSAMLLLVAGDCVHLQLTDGTIYEALDKEAYTSFTGYMVQPGPSCEREYKDYQ